MRKSFELAHTLQICGVYLGFGIFDIEPTLEIGQRLIQQLCFAPWRAVVHVYLNLWLCSRCHSQTEWETKNFTEFLGRAKVLYGPWALLYVRLPRISLSRDS